MIFGDRFYPELDKLSPWKQSLFSLVLTHRQFFNYALYTSLSNVAGKSEFLNALKALWEYHFQKFNHIDLKKELEKFEPFAIMEDTDEFNLGRLFALDASISLISAYDAIVSHEGDEAQIASRASMAGVIRKVEQETETDLDEEELRELPLVDREVDFQVQVFELLKRNTRGNKLCMQLLHLLYDEKLTNIGIEYEEDCALIGEFIFDK